MKKIIFTITFLFGFGIFFVAPKAFAAVSVTLGEGFPISAENLAPGDIIERDVFVTKDDISPQDLMILLTETGGWSTGTNDLKDKMSLKIQKPDSSFSILPNGTNSELLKDIFAYKDLIDPLNLSAFRFDTVSGVISTPVTYKLLFTFDQLAGNEFQNKKTEFSLSVGIFSQSSITAVTTTDNGGGGGGGGATRARAAARPVAPGLFGLAGTTGTATGTVGGAETASGEVVAGEAAPIVEGAETETVCSEWPLWVWILLLVIYTALFNYSSYRKNGENNIRWFAPLFWTAVILLVWYFWDKCRYYTWYPYAIVIIALLSYFSYLYWFRKKRLEPNFKDEEEIN